MSADETRETGVRAGYLRAGIDLADGRYRVELLLGVWGIRALYAVIETATGRAAMLNELMLTGSTDIEERVRPLMGLEHPVLPVIRDYFLREGLLYLVFNLAAGTTLDRALAAEATGRADERQVVAWGLQLADGLAFLHGQQPPLVVADLAPSAVLITPYNRLKLVGLGPMLGLYSTAETVGALEPGYAAPEVYQGRVDSHGDIYAAGVLLHRALSGSNPAVHAPGDLPAVRSLRPGISPELADAITRAVAPLPEERWPDAASFAAALRQADAAMSQPEQTEQAEVAIAASSEQPRPATLDGTVPDASDETVLSPAPAASVGSADASTGNAEAAFPFAEGPEDWPEPPAERELTPIPRAFMPPPDLSMLEAVREGDDGAPAPTSDDAPPPAASSQHSAEQTQAGEVLPAAVPTPAQLPHDELSPETAVGPEGASAAPAGALPASEPRQRRPGVLARLFGRRPSK